MRRGLLRGVHGALLDSLRGTLCRAPGMLDDEHAGCFARRERYLDDVAGLRHQLDQPCVAHRVELPTQLGGRRLRGGQGGRPAMHGRGTVRVDDGRERAVGTGPGGPVRLHHHRAPAGLQLVAGEAGQHHRDVRRVVRGCHREPEGPQHLAVVPAAAQLPLVHRGERRGGQHGHPQGAEVPAEPGARHRYRRAEQAGGLRLQYQQRQHRMPQRDLRTGTERGEQGHRDAVQDDEVPDRPVQSAQRPPAEREQHTVAEQRHVQHRTCHEPAAAPGEQRGGRQRQPAQRGHRQGRHADPGPGRGQPHAQQYHHQRGPAQQQPADPVGDRHEPTGDPPGGGTAACHGEPPVSSCSSPKYRYGSPSIGASASFGSRRSI